jgi:chemotaxis protein MotA
LDVTTLIGVGVGIACVLLGQMLEGGSIGSIAQLTAAIIVLGGTAGAVVTQFPREELTRGLRQACNALFDPKSPLEPIIDLIVHVSRRSRREGLLSVEEEADRVKDPFLKQALMGLVDGQDAGELRLLLESTIDHDQQYQEPGPRLFEAAGGYAPTIGILGAVLGLIHVMENLADPEKLGSGIAVAFVATVYGVGTANLVFLPLSQKLKMRIEAETRRKEMIVEGVCAIQEGISPQVIGKRLRTFLGGDPVAT